MSAARMAPLSAQEEQDKWLAGAYAASPRRSSKSTTPVALGASLFAREISSRPSHAADPETASPQSARAADAQNLVKQYAFYMKRALDDNNLREALKQGSLMLGELRTVALSPQKYYELYMQVWSELHHLESFFADPARHGRTNLELYELVQHAGNILPRLYLLVCVGSVYVKSGEGAAKDVLKDLVEMAKGVQHPIHGLFLRAYLGQASKTLLPDAGSPFEGEGGDTRDAVDFVLQNFTEMNKLWVRMQHGGPARDKDRREKERRELRDLVGKNLHVLSSLDGLDLPLYRDVVLPRVLEQVVQCKDDIAQPYLMDAVTQVFPDDFHLETLETLLGAVPQLKPSVRAGDVLASLMDRLSQAASDAPELADAFADADALGKFRQCVAAVVKAQPGLEARERLLMHASLMSFAVAAHRGAIELVDGILASCASALGAPPAGAARLAEENPGSPGSEAGPDAAAAEPPPPPMIVADPKAVKQLVALLTVPLETYDTDDVLRLSSYPRVMSLLQPADARDMAVAVVKSVLKGETAVSDPRRVETLFRFVASLMRDGGEEDEEDFEEAQLLMARLVHRLRSDDSATQLAILTVAEAQFATGGAKRLRRAAPPLAFEALRLGRAVVAETALDVPETETEKREPSELLLQILQFLYQLVSMLEQAACHDLALRLCLESARLADAAGAEHAAGDLFERAMTSYEEEIVDSKKQRVALSLIVGSLQSCENFSEETRAELADRAVGYAARLLKKPDRVAALAACAHLRWRRFPPNDSAEAPASSEEGGPAGSGDPSGVSTCLQKALKIANASLDASATTGAGGGEAAGLLVSVLDAHLWFFENGCEGAPASAVAELLARADAELTALGSRGACPPDVRAHYDATVRHVKHQRDREGAVGARYRDLPEA